MARKLTVVTTAAEELRDRVQRTLDEYLRGGIPAYVAMSQMTDAVADHEVEWRGTQGWHQQEVAR